MSVRFSWRYTRVVALAALIWVFASVAAFAQFPGGPPPGGPGGPPPGGFGGPGGGPFGGPGGPGVVNVPIEALAAGLKLNASQKTQIAQIQQQTHNATRSLMPQPGDGPPDRDAMQQAFGKMRELNEKATSQIKAVLTADQQKALPGVLRDVQTLNSVGIPAELIGDLKLTSDQKEKIAAVARESRDTMRQKMQEAQQSGDPDSMRQAFQQARKQTHEQAMTVLTDSQKSKVTAYISAHPRPQGGPGFGFGGPGGPGGPPPGGPGGPGGDGPGGPPPGGPPPGGDPNDNN